MRGAGKICGYSIEVYGIPGGSCNRERLAEGDLAAKGCRMQMVLAVIESAVTFRCEIKIVIPIVSRLGVGGTTE
jgi:hypothetical protein